MAAVAAMSAEGLAPLINPPSALGFLIKFKRINSALSYTAFATSSGLG